MDNGNVANQGKTAFVEKYFASNPDGNLESVNKAWTTEGNEGTLSESLVGKVRARLGLTGKKKVEEPKPTGTPTKARTKAKKAAKPVERSAPVSHVTQAPAGTVAATGFDDDDLLDDLEEGIDVLIQRIRELGNRPDVVKALRRARRLLVRSHLA